MDRRRAISSMTTLPLRKSLPSTLMVKITSEQGKHFFSLDQNYHNVWLSMTVDCSVIERSIVFDLPIFIVSTIKFDYWTQLNDWCSIAECSVRYPGTVTTVTIYLPPKKIVCCHWTCTYFFSVPHLLLHMLVVIVQLAQNWRTSMKRWINWKKIHP